ncbi:hypothetical protein QOZ80_8BG0666970 [Eleusine coracana subsp. coracana]|nr:hypothetical protein QOZ80_8BG0666970 [Eleusine coracana subsp. coracana]
MEGGTPKKKIKKTISAQSSIMPLEENAPPTSMSFPPSQTLEVAPTKKRKHADSTPKASKSQSLEVSSKAKGTHNNSNSGASRRSRSDSNQPIEDASHTYKAKLKKMKCTKKKVVRQEVVINVNVAAKSPSMCTRSKTGQPASPARAQEAKEGLAYDFTPYVLHVLSM